MTPIPKLLKMATAAAVMLPAVASAQRAGEIILYSNTAFRGVTFVASGARENVIVPFVVRSVRMAPGDRWEICPQSRYRGNCNTISQDQSSVTWVVASLRPRERGTTLPAPVPGNNQSLRGMASEYFPQPSDRAGRLPSCPNGSGSSSCAGQSADRFCQSRGWSGASYEQEEAINGRRYLADVLCTRRR